jgi:nucleotide-binding universal stress UspA family protein
LALRFGAALHTISVAKDERDATRLRSHAQDVFGAPDASQVVVGEDVARAIARRADDLGSCVVCISTRGHGRIAGAMIGSVARAVLQDSRQPIVAVGRLADRPPFLVGRPRRRPRSHPEPLSVPRIVACIDDSERSAAVLPVAAAWSKALDMQLSIVTVVDDAAGRAKISDVETRVRELTTHWREHVPAVDGHVLNDPVSVPSGLVAHLRTHPAGLIAVATEGRAGLERVRYGAAAAAIVRSVPVPALVVPIDAPDSP